MSQPTMSQAERISKAPKYVEEHLGEGLIKFEDVDVALGQMLSMRSLLWEVIGRCEDLGVEHDDEKFMLGTLHGLESALDVFAQKMGMPT